MLSGGEKRRVALCRLLLSAPDMLLLDEPTNHLDADSVAWLEHFLHDFPGTVVAITHDRYFLDNVAGWILELDRGAGIPYEGNYSGWLETKSERLAQESKQQSAHEKAMKDELEWVRKGAKARQSKSKARLQRFEEMQSQEFQKRSETNEIYIPVGPRLGDKVIDFVNVSKGYGDRALIDNLSFSMPKGAIVGVIGAIFVLVLAHFMGWTNSSVGWLPFVFLSIVVLGFCTWEGGLIGIQKPNINFAPFQKILKEGKHILLIDSNHQQESTVDRIVGSHPHIQYAGVSESSWGVKLNTSL